MIRFFLIGAIVSIFTEMLILGSGVSRSHANKFRARQITEIEAEIHQNIFGTR